MNRCSQCGGFVPPNAKTCPNCRSTWRAWWMAPLAIAGAGVASVTLSACYGVPCAAAATKVTLPDGETTSELYCGNPDGGSFDCRAPLPDGGNPQNDPEWTFFCSGFSSNDGGVDGGSDGGP
jgi:hypothetical protein